MTTSTQATKVKSLFLLSLRAIWIIRSKVDQDMLTRAPDLLVRTFCWETDQYGNFTINITKAKNSEDL